MVLELSIVSVEGKKFLSESGTERGGHLVARGARPHLKQSFSILKVPNCHRMPLIIIYHTFQLVKVALFDEKEGALVFDNFRHRMK